MNRLLISLLFAIVVHLLLLLIAWLFIKNIPQFQPSEPKEERFKVSLEEFETKQTHMPKPRDDMLKRDELAHEKQSQKYIEAPLLHHTPTLQRMQTTINSASNAQPKDDVVLRAPSITPVPLQPKKSETNTTKKEPTLPKAALYTFLSRDVTASEKPQEKQRGVGSSSINQNIKELYGSEFAKLSQVQQEYITNNQEVMRRITQEVLNRVASVNIDRSFNADKTNAIEFFLHPNGDMSDFRYLSKSGNYVLDATTKETIEYAYSRYPRPREKTLIRYNVFYNLAH